MTYSMTGFGKASGQYKDKTYTIEIKTLNAKSSDVRLKVPGGFRAHEIKLRQYVLDKVIRGKSEVNLSVVSDDGDGENSLNLPLIKKYVKELQEVSRELGIPNGDFIQGILRIPNVVRTSEFDIDENEWTFIIKICDQAVEHLNEFRTTEGEMLKKDIVTRVKTIAQLNLDVIPHAEARITKLKERMSKNLEDFMTEQKVDKNRFEQEIIYYIEKLDIHEEKVRLEQHCKYFLEEINNDTLAKGKKLSFLAQEIGREINTLGSKAQYTEIQKIVVEMKNELDQIREQLANLM